MTNSESGNQDAGNQDRRRWPEDRRQDRYNWELTRGLVPAFGASKPLAAWAADERCVVSREALRTRLALGWDPDDAITKPRHDKPELRFTHAGRTTTLRRWADQSGIRYHTPYNRIMKSGMSFAEALEKGAEGADFALPVCAFGEPKTPHHWAVDPGRAAASPPCDDARPLTRIQHRSTPGTQALRNRRPVRSSKSRPRLNRPRMPLHHADHHPHPWNSLHTPTLRILSLGAGIQSSAMLALSAKGALPKADYAIFADTGWEPRAVYAHLDRIEREIATPAGIPILRVTSGNIRNDALDPDHRFASMPLYILNKDGKPGMTRRQCTGEYKIKPIKKKVRELLGYPYPQRIPKDVFVEQWVGISTDEFHRAKDADVRYMHNAHPLIDMGWSRGDCIRYLATLGLADTPKSSCLGCPFHGNAQWRHIRDTNPDEWQDVVEFDAAIRQGNARANQNGNKLLGQAFLHRSRIPLVEAPIDHVTAAEWVASQQQLDTGSAPGSEELEEGAPDGCSPWACRGSEPAPKGEDFDLAA